MRCGVRGIRTPEPVLPITRFPGVPLQPLEHHSKGLPLKIGCKYRNFYLHSAYIFFFLFCSRLREARFFFRSGAAQHRAIGQNGSARPDA